MSSWDAYPPDYRQAEVRAILSALRAGECVSLVGLSGAGKSNLVGYLTNRCQPENGPALVLVDGNRAIPRTACGLLRLAARALSAPAPAPGMDELAALEDSLARRLAGPGGLCLVFDRFDALPPEEQQAAAGPLRALRDAFKYQLTYLTATRRPLDPNSELAELFYANTLWLGPLNPADARWSIEQYRTRQVEAGRELAWDEAARTTLARISWGYPALLRACCEALALGCPLAESDLRAHPAVQRRVQEFWADRPSAEDVQRSGLSGQPLLGEASGSGAPAGAVPDALSIQNPDLTASEQRLLACLLAQPGHVVEKDALIQAVWPADKVIDGLRDDSLAQLIRRLRQKVEPDPANPRYILTVPGRGYRYAPEE